MQIQKTDLPKSEILLTVTIPTAEVKAAYQKVLEEIAKDVELKGFRKGKAPLELVEKELGKKVVYEKAAKTIIVEAYTKAIDQENLRPITPPKTELISAEEDKDWLIKFRTSLRPKVNLKNYKKAISDFKASKRPKIIVPGKPEPTPEEQKPSLNELLTTLLSETEVEISDLLIEDEANRMLSGLIDQLQKIGLTVDQYLASKNTTVENLRQSYINQARDTLKLEFILDEIAGSENIEVTHEDLQKALDSIKDEKEKEAVEKNSYYLAAILRKQKTLDFLENLV